MINILYILIALIILSLIVTSHEFGHFFVGKKLGFKIIGFSVGMGPALFKRTRKGTEYAIRAFPIGGMCQFVGEEDPSDTKEGSFNSFPAWKRLLVILAGPVMNILLALVLSVFVLMAYGNYMPQIYSIDPNNTPAACSELSQGDVIVSVDGKNITFYNEVFTYIQDASPEKMDIRVKRDGTERTVTLNNIYNEEKQSNFLGVTIAPVQLKYGFFESISFSFKYIYGIVRETFAFFGTLFNGTVKNTDVAGPIGTIAYVSQAVKYGFETILQMSILISISLGIMNILPIPALDGGRILFIVIEMIIGKPLNRKIENYIHLGGFALLMVLILFLTYNDIVSLIKGSFQL